MNKSSTLTFLKGFRLLFSNLKTNENTKPLRVKKANNAVISNYSILSKVANLTRFKVYSRQNL